MNLTVLIGSLFVLLIIVLYGLVAGLKVKTSSDFFLAGGHQGFIPIIATQVATGLGAGSMIGWVGFGYLYGFGVLFYALAAIIGLIILLNVAGTFIQKNNIYTVPDWITHSLGEDKWLRGISAIMSIWVLVGAWAAMTIGIGTVINQLTDFPVIYGSIIGGLTVLVYCCIGGLVSVIKTDILCFVLLWIGVLVILPSAVSDAGGLSNILSVSKGEETILFPPLTVIFGWFIAVMPGQLATQTYYQRFAASKNLNVVKWGIHGTIISVILIGFYAAITGMAIRVINPIDLANPQLAVPWFVVNNINPFFSILILGGIISAIVSTSDSVLNSAASNISNDFYKGIINQNASDSDILLVGRISTVIIGLIGIVIALFTPYIMQLIIGGYSVSVGCLVFPLIISHYWKKTTKTGAIAGMLSGFIIVFPGTFIPEIKEIISSIFYHTVLAALIISLIFTVVVSLFSKK
jgi:solute:Na+ symporter, SSS family